MNNSQTKPRIFIVDDDVDFVSDLSIMLSAEFDIDSAHNTEDAQHFLQSKTPACVLVDLHMAEHFSDNPEREGLAFIRQWRQSCRERQRSSIPMIIISAHADATKVKEAELLGVGGVFTKPLNIASLKERMYQLIKKEGHAGVS